MKTPSEEKPTGGSVGDKTFAAPSIALPKGGGAIRGIGEKFAANPVTGTGSMSVPVATSPGRSGFGPQLSLSYDSGSGNGPFGFGWSLSLPSITRKTDKGLPKYRDAEDSDFFILSGAEDLVPVFKQGADRRFILDENNRFVLHEETRNGYRIRRYRPRIEGLFARIERWKNETDPKDVCWCSISRDNVTTWYGKTENSRIFDPEDPARIFSWLICQSYDDKGNAIVYEYKKEDSQRIFEDRQGRIVALAHERNRSDSVRSANRYLKRIRYGNRVPNRNLSDWQFIDPAQLPNDAWMFEVVFDYGEDHYAEDAPDDQGQVFARARIDSPDGSHWPVRLDPFSAYRAAFEVRTYRLCRRVLMFHHFPQELGIDDCLVRSTDFTYSESPVASFLNSVSQSGYVRRPGQNQPNRYLKKSLPPLEFEYTRVPAPQEMADIPLEDIDAESLKNLPVGLDGSTYQWADLDGEGLSGILTEQAGGWFYKANLGGGRFGPLATVALIPSLAALNKGGWQLLDLAGDGQLDLVNFKGPLRGFYERTYDRGWEQFVPFISVPNIDWEDPSVRFVDLTGDGHADILITENDVFTWYPSLAETGFSPAEKVYQPNDEEHGPRIVYADRAQSISLADISGDGLSDLVRIRNGEVCYWPNLGYGRFGAKVSMDNPPWFDYQDRFDPGRIRLADTDGSGTTDILYLGTDCVRIYFNQSGNRWSNAVSLPQFPQVDNLTSVQVLDLKGNGTACLVWSSPGPKDIRRPMKYLDLMAGKKPHLLTRSSNNLGAETVVHYAPSTKFYLADKKAGKPWITRLPFPVHVVERIETYDHISRNRFVTRYEYHHGYFDGIEREFRGFGTVEQWDTEEYAALSTSDIFPVGENIDISSHVPPVHTKTWFHTGVYLGREQVSRQFEEEYFREPGLTIETARPLLLDDTILPSDLALAEEREACRALKGSMLRQEVYADDAGPDASPDQVQRARTPYTVTEQNFTIRALQPRGANRHAVFFTHARESISYHYERYPTDPRVGHTLTLEVDGYGNVLKSAAVGYGRRQPDPNLSPSDQAKQAKILITYTENCVTIDQDTGSDAIDQDNGYRTPLPCESRTFELTGVIEWQNNYTKALEEYFHPKGRDRFTFDEILDAGTMAIAIDYEALPSAGRIEKRMIEHVRTYYRRNDLTGTLPLGKLQSLALPFESYKLAFTPGMVSHLFGGRITNAMLDGTGAIPGGRYVHTEGDAKWWIPSGQIFYSPNSADVPAQELTFARQHFFLPHRYRDPFHTNTGSTESFVTYDIYDLLVHETRDPLGNQVTVGERRWVLPDGTVLPEKRRNEYRVLQPGLVMDPNRNCSEVRFDALGMVVGTAVMGKLEENPRPGDRLTAAFHADLTQADIDQFLANPKGPMAATLLAEATTRVVYDLTAYWREPDPAKKPPAVAATLARETHVSDLQGQPTKIQVSLSYSDGFGREIQKKIQVEPGPVPQRDPGGKIILGPNRQPIPKPDDVSPRWVGSGWTVFNNKGKPVRQYEPFFTDTHRFEFDVRIGVSPVLFYDPVERVVATLHPNHTWEKVVFDPWRQKTWDVSDTVVKVDPGTGDVATFDPKTDADVGSFFSRLHPDEYLPTWDALRTNAAHAADFAARYPDATDRINETRAAEKTRVHAATPTIAHADSLGRTFLSVAHNKLKYSDKPAAAPPVEEFHATRIILDIEGNQREVIDAKDRVVMRYDYDMFGNRVHQTSMEAGERRILNDVTGKPLYAWDSRDHRFRTDYDQLRRPTISLLSEGGGDEVLIGQSIYGETIANSEAENLRGKVIEVRDQAGVVTSDYYDFKGNLLRSQRRLARDYKNTLNWSGDVPLEPETYTSRTRYDALNRPTQLIAPHAAGAKVNVVQPGYNDANLLERIDVWLDWADPGLDHFSEPDLMLDRRNQAPSAVGVADIDYDAKGQRVLIDYSNGVRKTYSYDPLTFRLTHLLTRRNAVSFPGDCPEPPPAGWPGYQVQNLHYTYDPAGNITNIRDNAQQTIYFSNRRVEPSAEYTYDAIYRLIEATGREHLGQVGGAPIPHSYNDASRVGVYSGDGSGRFSPNDGNVMDRYCECYEYDAVGNIMEMIHRVSCLGAVSWRRSYAYDETSQLDNGKKSNRLTSTTIGARDETYSTNGDGYDPHGNMVRMPHLKVMQWDFKDQLRMTQRQAVNPSDVEGATRHGERTWYVYDSNGQRVRKITDRAAVQGREPNRMKERIYFGGFEIYHEYENDGETISLQRETLHIMDDKQSIALVETKTSDSAQTPLIRYQFGNHLGSVSLELDEQAKIISYEEYTPYGSSIYQAVRSQTQTAKRYRYTGKERDEESGLYYHAVRYYAPGLGRWMSCDPLGLADSTCLYRYVQGNPIHYKDPSGKQSEGSSQVLALGLYELDINGNRAIREPAQLALDAQKAIGQGARATTLAEHMARSQPVLESWINEMRAFEEYLQCSRTPTQFDLRSVFKGTPSALYVQEVLQGKHGYTDIYFDLRYGVNPRMVGHTGSELRSILAHIQTGEPRLVNIHFMTEKGLSTLRSGAQFIEGAPLPSSIAETIPMTHKPTTLANQGVGSTSRAVSGTSSTKNALPKQTAQTKSMRKQPRVFRAGDRSSVKGLTRTTFSSGVAAEAALEVGFYGVILPMAAQLMMHYAAELDKKIGASRWLFHNWFIPNLKEGATIPQSDVEVMEGVTGAPTMWSLGFY